MVRVKDSCFSIYDRVPGYKLTFNANVVCSDKDLRSDYSICAKSSSQNLKAYFLTGLKNVSFGHKLREGFETWGATYDSNKQSTSFKLWAPKFYDSKEVYVETRSKRDALSIKDVIKDQVDPDRIRKLNSQDGCTYTLTVKGVKPGDYYRYVSKDAEGEFKPLGNDPYSMWLDNVNGWSRVLDHNAFKWNKNENKWQSGKPVVITTDDGERISYKKVSRTGSLQPSNLVIDEVHIGTLTEQGDFEAAKDKIREIAQKGIFNAVEFMPIESSPSMGWSYDATGTGKFAVANYYYGDSNPDKFKELVQVAHENGLNVILDMVPNHMSYFGNYLQNYDSGFLGKDNGWGGRFNVQNPMVRNMLVNMGLNWIKNYHVDGLRFDMTKDIDGDYMESSRMMKQLAVEIKTHCKDAVLIAEDARDTNDGKRCAADVTRPLSENDVCDANSQQHLDVVDSIVHNRTSLGNIGFDSQWGFALHHTLYTLLTSRDYPFNDKYRSSGALEKFAEMVKYDDLSKNIFPLMTHDEIGNLDGTRLVSKLLVNKLDMMSRVKKEPHNIRSEGIIAANAVQRLLEDYYKPVDQLNNIWNYQQGIDIAKPVTRREFAEALKEVRDIHRLGLGLVFVLPCPKMLFQGDEYGEISTFKFFRNEHPEAPTNVAYDVMKQKGYSAELRGDNDAFHQSKLTRDKASDELKREYDKMEQFTRQLAKVCRENPALYSDKNNTVRDEQGEIVSDYQVYPHKNANVLQVYRKEGDNEVIALVNFGDRNYFSTERFGVVNPMNDGKLPIHAKWEEILNSKYGEQGNPTNSRPIESDDYGQFLVNLPKHSMIVLRRKADS